MDGGPERVLISNCFGCSGRKISREQCVVKERKLVCAAINSPCGTSTVFPHTSLSSAANSVSDREEGVWGIQSKISLRMKFITHQLISDQPISIK